VKKTCGLEARFAHAQTRLADCISRSPCRVGSGIRFGANFSKVGFASRDIAPCCARTRRQVLEASLYVGALRVNLRAQKVWNVYVGDV
jgi:hypothetical protein